MDIVEDTIHSFDQVFIDILETIKKHNVEFPALYFILGNSFCRIAKASGKPVEDILKDFEDCLKSMPEPIEEVDD